jgi:hypothetical protein
MYTQVKLCFCCYVDEKSYFSVKAHPLPRGLGVRKESWNNPGRRSQLIFRIERFFLLPQHDKKIENLLIY